MSKAETISKDVKEEFTNQSPPVSLTESSRFAECLSKTCGLALRSRKRFVDGRLVNHGELSLRARKVKTVLEKIDAISKEAHPAIDRVEVNLAVVINSHNMSPNKYLAMFDALSLPKNEVVNLSDDTEKDCLKRAILSDSFVER